MDREKSRAKGPWEPTPPSRSRPPSSGSPTRSWSVRCLTTGSGPPISRLLDGEGMWDRNEDLFGWTAFLGERRGGSDVSPYAAPARAEDLADLPRTYIDTGSAKTFRDEALTYAQRLSQAGVSMASTP